jgi:release factor glutamine methyltransferase
LTDTPALDAQVLLAHVLEKPRAWVLAHPEAELGPEQARALEQAVQRLESGAPLPYVLGKWEFFGLEFEVTPEVLIPRPETELLVERALAWGEGRGAWGVGRGTWGEEANRLASPWPQHRPTVNRRAIHAKSAKADWGGLRALDVGTGSGCIAIALAVNAPGLQVVATDISPAALTVARRNAEKHAVADRVTFLEADLFPPALSPTLPPPNSLSLILANLPYIPTETLHGLKVYGREPTAALDGGADGLDLIRRLLAGAPRHLAPGGAVLLEIEASQGAKVMSLARNAFPEAKVILHKDLSSHDRLVEITC